VLYVDSYEHAYRVYDFGGAAWCYLPSQLYFPRFSAVREACPVTYSMLHNVIRRFLGRGRLCLALGSGLNAEIS